MNTRVAVIGFTVLASLVAVRAWGQSAPPAAPAPVPAPAPAPAAPAPAPAPPATPTAAAGTPAADAGSAGSNAGSATTSPKDKAAEESVDAKTTLPQFTAARGGSLGIPSSLQTSGLHAAVDAKFFEDKTNADAFAQLAGLDVSERVTADVVAQTVSQDVQRFVLSDGIITPQMYTATVSSAGVRARFRSSDIMIVSKIQDDDCLEALRQTVPDSNKEPIALIRLIGDAGFGAVDDSTTQETQSETANNVIKKEPKTSPGDLQKLRDAADAAKKDLAEKQERVHAMEVLSRPGEIKTLGSNASTELESARKKVTAAEKTLADATKAVEKAEDKTPITLHDRFGVEHSFEAGKLRPKARAVIAKCHLDQIKGLVGWSIIGGLHALRRTAISDGGQASIGGALEAIFQWDGLNKSWFTGLSFEYLNSAVDKDSGSKFIFPSFHALRVSAGYEIRGSHPSNGKVLVPRIGAYGVASWGWWRNNYRYQSQGGTGDLHIWSTELEAGVYAGGKFTNNFTGMLALRVLKSFGDFDRGTTFIVSLIPAVSAGK